MLKVRHFTGGLSTKDLHYLDQELNEWIEEEGIKIKMVHEMFGQSPTGMSGSLENALFVAVWYEPKESS